MHGSKAAGNLLSWCKNLGSVRLEAKDFPDIRASELTKALSLADLVEIYPLANGSVRIELTFHHMTHHLK